MCLSLVSLSLFVDFTPALITSAKRQELFSQALPPTSCLAAYLPQNSAPLFCTKFPDCRTGSISFYILPILCSGF